MFKIGDEVKLITDDVTGKIERIDEGPLKGPDLIWVRFGANPLICTHAYQITKTKRQRQVDSAEGEVRRRENLEAEYRRQRLLPTIDDKLRRIGEAIVEICENVNPDNRLRVAFELRDYLNQETQE